MKKDKIGMNKRMVVYVASTVLLLMTLCGCGQTETPFQEEDVQQSGQNRQAYLTIVDEEVPMAAMPMATEDALEENVAEAVSVETPMATIEATAAPTEETIAEETSAAIEEPASSSPAEVEVQLEAKVPQVEVIVETKPMQEDAFDAGRLAEDVCAAMNESRASNGLSPLTTTPELTQAANRRALEIAEKFSHTRPGDKDYHTAVTEVGGSFGYIGENLFRGTSTADAARSAWEASQVHLDNILCGNFHHVGIGVAVSDEQVYMVQIFTD